MESPLVFWVPSIAVAGMAVYTGDRFPAWKGNVFVGAMRRARSRAPVTSSASCSTRRPKRCGARRCSGSCRQRIREVRQGPDGLLYLLTDEDDGALLRIEPAP